MTDSKLIDSTIAIDYLFNGNYREIIETNEQLYLSAVSLFEVKRKLYKKKIDFKKIQENTEFLKKRFVIVDINQNIGEKAADIATENELPAMDALIYTTALVNNWTLITADNDFRGLKNAVILE